MMQAVMMPAFAAVLRRGTGSAVVGGIDGVYVIFCDRSGSVMGLGRCDGDSKERD